jgi:hypothetical protein
MQQAFEIRRCGSAFCRYIANFLFAFLSAALWWLLPDAYPISLNPLVQANLAIGGINLLPVAARRRQAFFCFCKKQKSLCAAVNLIAGIAAIAVFHSVICVELFCRNKFSLLVFALFLGGYMVIPATQRAA